MGVNKLLALFAESPWFGRRIRCPNKIGTVKANSEKKANSD
jgi:hypothetical protein